MYPSSYGIPPPHPHANYGAMIPGVPMMQPAGQMSNGHNLLQQQHSIPGTGADNGISNGAPGSASSGGALAKKQGGRMGLVRLTESQVDELNKQFLNEEVFADPEVLYYV